MEGRELGSSCRPNKEQLESMSLITGKNKPIEKGKQMFVLMERRHAGSQCLG